MSAHTPPGSTSASPASPRQIGHYQIIAKIGEGGMGEVYRARDTRLNRDVALKVLPQAFAEDPYRMARFEREAQLLASLNHPKIAAIYGLEVSGSTRALVMELVEGPTLAERIGRQTPSARASARPGAASTSPAQAAAAGSGGKTGERTSAPSGGRKAAISPDEALPIAQQVAEALEYAHEHGIVHRDLKPANVKITPEGNVKVLDFGLAKAMGPDEVSGDLSNSPTLSLAMTEAGIIIGTAAYMAPEQAKGKQVDRRADIWAFGCVLYEMLAGRKAFEGETISDVLAAVIMKDPDWTAVPETTPPAMQRLLRRCLEKDVRQRLQAIGEARIAIEDALAAPQDAGATTAAAVPAAKPLWKRTAPALAALILGGAFTGLSVWELRPAPPAPIVTRFAFPLGAGQSFTNFGRRVVAISPDGTEIVYAANARLYLRHMGELEAHVIPGTDSQKGIADPVFSPDGASIAFWSADDRTIKRIAVAGGAAVSLCPATYPFGLSWSGDGILFGQGIAGIMRVSANGGQPETVVRVKDGEAAGYPQMLPGGKAVLFTLAKVGVGNGAGGTGDWDTGEIVVQTLGGARPKVLIEGGSDSRYLPSGQLVYAHSGVLLAVPFDARRLQVTGGAVPVVEGVMRLLSSGIAQFSVSHNGTLVYVPGPVSASSSNNMVLALVDRQGHSEPLQLQPGPYLDPRVSPDGKQIAVESSDGKNSFIAIDDISGGTAARRLTFGGNSHHPVWSPDGNWVAFQSDRQGDLAIYRKRADGTGTAELLTKPDAGAADVPDSWSPDGKTLLFESIKGGSHSLWALSLSDGKATPFGNIPKSSNAIDAVFSPDGRWVAYSSMETGSDEIFVQPFPATGAKFQIPHTNTNHDPVWSRDGKKLIYATGPNRFAVVGITTRPDFAVGNAADVFEGAINSAPWVSRGFDLMPGGEHLLAVANQGQGQAGASSATPTIQVALNWFEELRQRVPTGR